MIVLGPLFSGVWAAGRLIRARERDARKLRELAEALERERVEEARLAVVEERARIARDLHDVVAHAMTTIVLEAGAERLSLGDDRGSTQRTLQSIERTGRQALVEMRRLLGVLHRDDEEPELAPTPGLAHLDELVERVERAGLAVETRVSGEPLELQPSLDITAYRIVQEALTNVLKHAGADGARVAVTFAERTLELEVADDGRGGTPNGRGHGLDGLREAWRCSGASSRPAAARAAASPCGLACRSGPRDDDHARPHRRRSGRRARRPAADRGDRSGASRPATGAARPSASQRARRPRPDGACPRRRAGTPAPSCPR